jgi:hypothetical protein
MKRYKKATRDAVDFKKMKDKVKSKKKRMARFTYRNYFWLHREI